MNLHLCVILVTFFNNSNGLVRLHSGSRHKCNGFRRRAIQSGDNWCNNDGLMKCGYNGVL
ncbi:hypothetical protein U1Q18_001419, partial [Sarracenia purpurea var. burkii]